MTGWEEHERVSVKAAWACAVVAWIMWLLIGGGAIDMAVGITLAASFLTTVVVVINYRGRTR